MFTKYFFLTFMVLLLSTSLIGCTRPVVVLTWEEVERKVIEARTNLFDVGGDLGDSVDLSILQKGENNRGVYNQDSPNEQAQEQTEAIQKSLLALIKTAQESLLDLSIQEDPQQTEAARKSLLVVIEEARKSLLALIDEAQKSLLALIGASGNQPTPNVGVGDAGNSVGLSKFGNFVLDYLRTHNKEPLLVMAKLANKTNFNIDVDRAFGIIKEAVEDTGRGIVYVELPYVSLKALKENDLGLYERILGDAELQKLKQKKPILALLSSIEQDVKRPEEEEVVFQTDTIDDGRRISTISLKMQLIDVQTLFITSTGEVQAEPIWEFDEEISTLEGGFELLLGNLVEFRPKSTIDYFNIEHFKYSKNAFNLITVDLTLENKFRTEQNLYYKFTWYNQEENIISGLDTKKRPVKISGNDSKNIKAIAPRVDAVKFKVIISDS